MNFDGRDSQSCAHLPKAQLHASEAKLEKVAVYEDDSGAIHLANNPMDWGSSKYIDFRHHLSRDVVNKDEMRTC